MAIRRGLPGSPFLTAVVLLRDQPAVLGQQRLGRDDRRQLTNAFRPSPVSPAGSKALLPDRWSGLKLSKSRSLPGGGSVVSDDAFNIEYSSSHSRSVNEFSLGADHPQESSEPQEFKREFLAK